MQSLLRIVPGYQVLCVQSAHWQEARMVTKTAQVPKINSQSPYNLAVDSGGNVFVADGSRLRKVTSEGQVSTIAGSAMAGYLNGTVANARFNGINGIVKDSAGNLYLADESNFVVRRIAPDGTVVTVAGSTAGYLDGPGSNALFTQTLGMAMDASGHIFLTQGGGLYKIRKITVN